MHTPQITHHPPTQSAQPSPPTHTPASAPPTRLSLYLFGIDQDAVQEVVWKLGLPAGAVVCTDRLTGADAVLAVRSKVKQGGWIKSAARAQGVLIYTVKSESEVCLWWGWGGGGVCVDVWM